MNGRAVRLAVVLAAIPAAAHAQCDLPRPAAGPARHGEDVAWYTGNEPVLVHGISWVKYGLPRAVQPGETMVYIGANEGVPIYAAASDSVAEVVYVLANSRCELQPYQAMRSLRLIRAGGSPASGTPPAALYVTGCPKGAHLYIFPAEEIAADPGWRSKLVPESSRYVGIAWSYHLLVLTSQPRPYEVVLAWRGRVWRFRVDAVPGAETAVHARPPGRRRCDVPDYPVM